MARLAENDGVAKAGCEILLHGFANYMHRFAAITRRARQRFRDRDWGGIRADTVERIDLYELSIAETADKIGVRLGNSLRHRGLWVAMKRCFAAGTETDLNRDIARTYFNSVTRKVFETVGIDREIEFFALGRPFAPLATDHVIYDRYAADRSAELIVDEILSRHAFTVPYAHRERDAKLVAREIDLYLWSALQNRACDAIEVIRSPFFRNKVAYLVGRICHPNGYLPLVLPLHNTEGGIVVDAALLAERDVSIVFSFAHSYFQVEAEPVAAVIDFLKSILPYKPLSELYSSIGHNRHGKTEFYRDLHRFVHRSRKPFEFAPGREGAMMIVFTLPHYDFVFKVIKDRACFLRSGDYTEKSISRDEVMRRYSLVRKRDRVGRLVDTQEFENLRFRAMRFEPSVLDEFRLVAQAAVHFDGDFVVINHLYVQRKVVPLPFYLQRESDPERIRGVVLDFGYFLKDLAATGIFPSDLFNAWNYGVTRRGRVVLFDYDDVWPLERPNFRMKPPPQNEFEEMESEQEWVVALQDDYFMDEIERYSGLPERLRETFRSVHADIYTVEFWSEMQRRVREGEIVDITPYDRRLSFGDSAAPR